MKAVGKILIGQDKKLKWSQDAIASVKALVDIHPGETCYITLQPCNEVDYKKDLIKYYSDIIVPAVFEALKSKGVKSIKQTHQFMLHKFSSPIEIQHEGLNIIPLPIEDMDNQQRIKFITEVGVWATKAFGIHLKSVNELT